MVCLEPPSTCRRDCRDPPMSLRLNAGGSHIYSFRKNLLLTDELKFLKVCAILLDQICPHELRSRWLPLVSGDTKLRGDSYVES